MHFRPMVHAVLRIRKELDCISGGGRWSHAEKKGAPLSFTAQLRAFRAIKRSDPWLGTLRMLRGRRGDDRVERISTDAIFDALDLPPFKRTPEAGKRVKTMMIELGWTPVRARHLTSNGFRSRLRGYARMPQA